jgi:hypothetical protein
MEDFSLNDLSPEDRQKPILQLMPPPRPPDTTQAHISTDLPPSPDDNLFHYSPPPSSKPQHPNLWIPKKRQSLQEIFEESQNAPITPPTLPSSQEIPSQKDSLPFLTASLISATQTLGWNFQSRLVREGWFENYDDHTPGTLHPSLINPIPPIIKSLFNLPTGADPQNMRQVDFSLDDIEPRYRPRFWECDSPEEATYMYHFLKDFQKMDKMPWWKQIAVHTPRYVAEGLFLFSAVGAVSKFGPVANVLSKGKDALAAIASKAIPSFVQQIPGFSFFESLAASSIKGALDVAGIEGLEYTLNRSTPGFPHKSFSEALTQGAQAGAIAGPIFHLASKAFRCLLLPLSKSKEGLRPIIQVYDPEVIDKLPDYQGRPSLFQRYDAAVHAEATNPAPSVAQEAADVSNRIIKLQKPSPSDLDLSHQNFLKKSKKVLREHKTSEPIPSQNIPKIVLVPENQWNDMASELEVARTQWKALQISERAQEVALAPEPSLSPRNISGERRYTELVQDAIRNKPTNPSPQEYQEFLENFSNRWERNADALADWYELKPQQARENVLPDTSLQRPTESVPLSIPSPSGSSQSIMLVPYEDFEAFASKLYLEQRWKPRMVDKMLENSPDADAIKLHLEKYFQVQIDQQYFKIAQDTIRFRQPSSLASHEQIFGERQNLIPLQDPLSTEIIPDAVEAKAFWKTQDNWEVAIPKSFLKTSLEKTRNLVLDDATALSLSPFQTSRQFSSLFWNSHYSVETKGFEPVGGLNVQSYQEHWVRRGEGAVRKAYKLLKSCGLSPPNARKELYRATLDRGVHSNESIRQASQALLPVLQEMETELKECGLLLPEGFNGLQYVPQYIDRWKVENHRGQWQQDITSALIRDGKTEADAKRIAHDITLSLLNQAPDRPGDTYFRLINPQSRWKKVYKRTITIVPHILLDGDYLNTDFAAIMKRSLSHHATLVGLTRNAFALAQYDWIRRSQNLLTHFLPKLRKRNDLLADSLESLILKLRTEFEKNSLNISEFYEKFWPSQSQEEELNYKSPPLYDRTLNPTLFPEYKEFKKAYHQFEKPFLENPESFDPTGETPFQDWEKLEFWKLYKPSSVLHHEFQSVSKNAPVDQLTTLEKWYQKDLQKIERAPLVLNGLNSDCRSPAIARLSHLVRSGAALAQLGYTALSSMEDFLTARIARSAFGKKMKQAVLSTGTQLQKLKLSEADKKALYDFQLDVETLQVELNTSASCFYRYPTHAFTLKGFQWLNPTSDVVESGINGLQKFSYVHKLTDRIRILNSRAFLHILKHFLVHNGFREFSPENFKYLQYFNVFESASRDIWSAVKEFATFEHPNYEGNIVDWNFESWSKSQNGKRGTMALDVFLQNVNSQMIYHSGDISPIPPNWLQNGFIRGINSLMMYNKSRLWSTENYTLPMMQKYNPFLFVGIFLGIFCVQTLRHYIKDWINTNHEIANANLHSGRTLWRAAGESPFLNIGMDLFMGAAGGIEDFMHGNIGDTLLSGMPVISYVQHAGRDAYSLLKSFVDEKPDTTPQALRTMQHTLWNNMFLEAFLKTTLGDDTTRVLRNQKSLIKMLKKKKLPENFKSRTPLFSENNPDYNQSIIEWLQSL